MIAAAVGRLRRACATWPDGRGWSECAAISLLAVLVITLIAIPTGVARWRPDLAGWPLRLISVMILPAFSEELVFRGLLIPDRGESRHPALWIAVATAVFVLWHVVEATAILRHAGLFLTPGFLVCAGVLGVACAAVRYRTGSLWPAVLLHGGVVFAWQALLGGPTVSDLR